MYEIWLMLNILYEIALPLWPALLLALLLWLGLLWAARAGLRASGWRQPALIGAGATALAFLALPAATQSSLGQLDYWVDWAFVAAVALGVGAAVALYAWPLLALKRRSS